MNKMFHSAKSKIVAISALIAVIMLVAIGVFIHREHTLERIYNEAQKELIENRGKYAEDVIVLYGTNERRAAALAERLGANLRISSNGNFATLTLPEGVNVDEVYSDRENRAILSEFSLDYKVSLAEAEEEESDALLAPNYSVNDDRYYLQTYLNYINVGNVWNSTLGRFEDGKKVKVAIIDTGIDTDHPEFFDKNGNSIISLKSYNATEDKVVEVYGSDISLIEDTNGHGTAVAGIIASQMDAVGIVGLSPEVELLVIKCEVDEGGEFRYSSDLVFGIYYAIEQDVDVINMSFSGLENVYSAALTLAVDSDIICVASAGNNGTDVPLYYPAADKNAIGVGALEQNGWEIASYSNYGDNSDIVAPGTTYTAAIGGGYTYKNGTSMSAPIVSSAAALYVAYNKYVTYDVFRAELLAAGKDLGDAGEDRYFGFGCLDVNALVLEEKGTITYDHATEELKNTTQVFVREHTIQTVPMPEREKLVFDDWYYDKAYTKVFDYSAYYSTEMIEDITLYAKWVNEDDEGASVYDYQVLDDGTAEILSYKGKRRYLTIPDTLDGYTVSSIGDNAFSGNARLREVTFPRGLVYIKSCAFSVVKNLRKITFTGDKLLAIEEEAFALCESLLTLDLPDSVVTIGDEAFNECKLLSKVDVSPESMLQYLGTWSFRCTSLTEFYVPKYSNFSGSVLAYSKNMRSVTIHPENTEYLLDGHTVYNSDRSELVYYPPVYTDSYAVADTVRKIGDSAFTCSRVPSIELSHVEVIDVYAFADTKNLKAVYIPDSVTQLGAYAFINSGIYELRLSENLKVISKAAFSNTNISSLHIPAAVTNIIEVAFSGNSRLKTLTFAENSRLDFIDQVSFYDCGALGNFALPDSLTHIGKSAFSNCSSITALTIPVNLNYIGEKAFAKCTSLKTLSFDEGCALTELSESCFSECIKLETVNFSDNIMRIGDFCFNSGLLLHTLNFGVKSRLETVGNYAFYSCASLRRPQIPDTVVSIGDFAYSFSGLTSVHIPRALTSIGKGSFGACYLLTEITVSDENRVFAVVDNVLFDYDITTVHCVPSSRMGRYTLPDTVKVVSYYAFYYDTLLTEVILPAGLEDIREHAFYQCSLLQSIDIPAPVFNIGRYAFAYCYSLSEVNFAEDAVIERLGIYTFVSCRSLKEISIPPSVSSMAQYVFFFCDSLKKITFSENSALEYISAYMFSGCDSLESIVFEKGSALKSIQAHAFNGICRLKTLDFGDAKIENIDNYAFMFCDKLESFTIPESVTYIGRYAFYGCSSLIRLDIPKNVEYIGENAFWGSENIRIFFAADSLPVYAQGGWDSGIAGYFLNAKEYVSGEIWDYIITFDNTVAIVTYKGTDKSVTVDTVDGMPVVKIGARAFFDNDNLTRVTLNEGLLEIGNGAFSDCGSLKSLEIPASVEKIGDYAFSSSNIAVTFDEGSRLKKIGSYAFTNNVTSEFELPDSLEIILDYAFYYSSVKTLHIGEGSSLTTVGKDAFVGSQLRSVYLPDSLKEIKDGAFRGLTCLTSVTIAEGNTALKIGNSAFNNTGIAEITIPERVNYIGEYALGSNPKLQNIFVSSGNTAYTSIDGILCDVTGTTLIQYPTGRSGAYCVPAEITVLTYASFKDAKGLTELSFAEGSIVKTIGWQTLSGCTSLKKITVPDSLVSFDFYACENCTSLTEVLVGKNSAISGIYEGAFSGCTSLKYIALPKAIKEIGEYAFYGCSSLTAIPLSDEAEVRGIYGYAFYGCHGITEIPHFSELVEIGEYAFANTSVTEYLVPAKVRSIASSAFSGTQVESFSVEQGNALYKTIDGIIVEYGETDIKDAEFMVWPAARPFVVGEGKTILTAADAHDFYSSGASYIEIAGGVTNIADWAFYGCPVTRITLPDGLKSIGMFAFYGSSQLSVVSLPSGVEKIDVFAFAECPRAVLCFRGDTLPVSLGASWSDGDNYVLDVRDIELNESALYVITNDGNAHFAKNYASGVVTVKQSVNGAPVINIMKGAFRGDSIITDIIFPANITKIYDGMFEGATSLYGITIPDNITEIGSFAFSGCTNLENIKLGKKLISIGTYAFRECESLKSISLPESMTQIGDYAFVDAKTLSEIIIPDGLTKIGKWAFDGCTSLGEIVIPKSVTNIGSYAFYRSTALIGLEHSSTPSGFDFMWNGEVGYVIDFKEFVYDERAVYGVSNNGTAMLMRGTKNIYSISVPENINGADVTEISASSFRNNKNLESVTLPEGVKKIGEYAFSDCTSLTEIIIPESVEMLENGVFFGCTNLFVGFVSESLPQCGWAWDGDNSLEGNMISGYCLGAMHFGYTDDMVYAVKKDGNAILARLYDAMGTVIIPETVNGMDIVEIGSRTFFKNTGLKSVVLTEKINRIGNQAFAGCTSLESIIIPRSVSSIADYAFENCTSLTSITIPDSITDIGREAFSGCAGVRNIYFNAVKMNSVFQKYVFSGVGTQTDGVNVTVGKNVTEIPDGLFYSFDVVYGPVNIKRVVFEEGSVCREIGDRAFGDCLSLESIIIPNGLTSIGGYAFENCTNLKSIIIPDGLTSINAYAFDNCTGLKSIIIPSSVTTIDSNAFESCRAVIGFSSPHLPKNLGYMWNGDCAYYTDVKEIIIDGDTSKILKNDGSIVEAVSGALLAFMEYVEKTKSSQRYSEKYSLINSAIVAYEQLSDEDKVKGEAVYNELVSIIEGYNADANQTNENHIGAYASAARIILAVNTLLLGAWFILSKKLI